MATVTANTTESITLADAPKATAVLNNSYFFLNQGVAQGYTTTYQNLDLFKIDSKFDVNESGLVKVYNSLAVDKNLSVSGNTTIAGNLQINGQINLGDAVTDLLTVSGRATIGTNLTVSGNTILGASGKTISTTGLLAHTGRATISTNLSVAGNTALGDSVADITSISGSATVAKNLTVSGNAAVTGILTVGGISTGSYSAGQVIKVTVLSGASDLGGGTYTNATTDYTNVVSYTYTPVSSSSYLVIEFICRYTISGSGGDTFNARIVVNEDGSGVVAGSTQMSTTNPPRTPPLTPFWVRYTNSNIAAKIIAYQAARGSSDDTITFYAGEDGCYLQITEIAR